MSPDKARYFPCNRRISASVKKHIEMNDSVGINVAKNFNSIVVEVGGHENVSFLEEKKIVEILLIKQDDYSLEKEML